MSTPKPNVKRGIIITPPPKPVRDPINPANKAPAKRIAIKVNIVSLIFVYL